MNQAANQPDYLLSARLAGPDSFVEDVPISVSLPPVPTGRIRITARPPSVSVDRIGHWPHCYLLATHPSNLDGSGSLEVHSSLCYPQQMQLRIRGGTGWESTARIKPVFLRITELHEPSAACDGTRIQFWLTPNKHLFMGGLREFHADGAALVRPKHGPEVQLQDDCTIRFQHGFNWVHPSDGVSQRLSFLVGEAQTRLDAHDPKPIEDTLTRSLDALLLLASVGSSTRTTCVGWSASDARGITRFYRRHSLLPKGNSHHAIIFGLISRADFAAFLRHAWARFQSSPYRSAIEALAYALVPPLPGTFETDYLRMFSALEEVLLTHQRLGGSEVVLPPQEWNPLRDALKACIKENLGSAHRIEQRRQLYDKLAGLNRVPLRRAFEAFVTEKAIDLSDLWPLYGTDRSGLAELRNKLVHGDFPQRIYFTSCGVAQRHLFWTLQRVFLHLLDWPLDRSEVAPAFLAQHHAAVTARDSAMKELHSLLRQSF